MIDELLIDAHYAGGISSLDHLCDDDLDRLADTAETDGWLDLAEDAALLLEERNAERIEIEIGE